MEKFYITTPIYYVNDKPHIGHAYTTVAADILARYHRMIGHEVFFLTGTDEHGKKIADAADKLGQSPKDFVDEQAAKFQFAWDELDISYDDFIRTTEARHEKAASLCLQQLHDRGFVYKDTYKGLYCVGCEGYKSESELVEGKCPDHKKAPMMLSEENWFFRLSGFAEKVRKLIESNRISVMPEARRNEILQFLNGEVKDIAISRKNVPWGIPLPFDREQTAYVWIEALMNYISAIQVHEDPAFFQKWWPADVQLMAKDIVKFHAVIWPALLLALDLEAPRMIFGHGFFTIEGHKMSKTIGNVIDPLKWAESTNADSVRYFLMRELSFGQDGDISEDRFYGRYTADLSNGLGNLASRVLALASKQKFVIQYEAMGEDVRHAIDGMWKRYHQHFTQVTFHELLNDIWKAIGECDLFLEHEKPWELSKQDPKRYEAVLSMALEALRNIAWALYPVMPETSHKLLTSFQVFNQEQAMSFDDRTRWGGLQGEAHFAKIQGMFPRLEIKK